MQRIIFKTTTCALKEKLRNIIVKVFSAKEMRRGGRGRSDEHCHSKKVLCLIPYIQEIQRS